MGVNQMEAFALSHNQSCRVIINDILESIITDKRTGEDWIKIFETENKSQSRQVLAETRKSIGTITFTKQFMIRCYLPNSIHSIISSKIKCEIIHNKHGSYKTINTVEESEAEEVRNNWFPLDPVLGIPVIQIEEIDERNIADAGTSFEKEIGNDGPYFVEISDNESEQINNLEGNNNRILKMTNKQKKNTSQNKANLSSRY